MSVETRQTNKSVGSITMVNLTGNELEVWVNSSRTSHIIPKMRIDHSEYREHHPSPVVAKDGAEFVGVKPATEVFLRAIEKRAGYFHNNYQDDADDYNVVKIDVSGNEVTYKFKINGEGNQVLKNSAVLTITRSSFTVAAPDGEIWYQSFSSHSKQEKTA
ncbi:hypothetical protein QL989_03675 [Pseudoalteromonas sp. APC 3224]|uniref:hypothetical protein n=1 Tax=Pseudoalteromonas sp. APC 3224 TaxID=3035203 RepID=UPI0025B2CDFF|nr:hypothetical protein [Pseudoalteromonas sp. APC 3224]MDN3484441.1 hypothetical protein [Pseudoalteromonas sp. APC 3224]